MALESLGVTWVTKTVTWGWAWWRRLISHDEGKDRGVLEGCMDVERVADVGKIKGVGEVKDVGEVIRMCVDRA